MADGRKKAQPSRATALLRPIVRLAYRRRAVLGALLVLAASCYAGLRMWSGVEDEVRLRADYALAPHQIQITPRPPWIRADVKSEALRAGSLDGTLSILDDRIAERLAKAFSLHPWVARVERVAKQYPPLVLVELIYRRPAAMVEVPGGLFPVDEQGVLLPSDDFSTAEAHRYPRIAGMNSQPLGSVGTAWGDRHVLAAVKIAQALNGVWHELHLHSIRRVWASAGERSAPQVHFELVTTSGVVIPWGTAPGGESASEPTAAEKIARLKAYAADYGGLDESARRNDLDLRVRSTRTTAREPKF